MVRGTRLLNLKVDSYDPIISQPRRNFNLPISYVERNVVKIFYHWKSTHDDRTTVSKRNLIMMVLDIALIYYPAIGILQPSMERSVNYDGCLLVSLFDDNQSKYIDRTNSLTRYIEFDNINQNMLIMLENISMNFY